MADELEPCPKCGKSHLQIRDGKRGDIPGLYVWCSACGITSRLFTYDPIIRTGKSLAREACVESWNTRTETRVQATIDELVSALEEIAETPNNGWMIARTTLSRH